MSLPTTRVDMNTTVDPNRSAGALLGLAGGNARGRPVGGLPVQAINEAHDRLTEMVGGGVHHQLPDTLTDDTDLACCIARSLVAWGEFAPTMPDPRSRQGSTIHTV